MDFWITMVRLARSVRVMVPTAVLSVALVAAVVLAVPPTYAASATMVLTSTEFGGTVSRDPRAPTELVNPMLLFNDSLRTSADMLIWSMSNTAVKDQLEHDGRVEVTVDNGRTNPDLLSFNGPIIYVSARSASAQAAQEAVVRASSIMRQKLRVWQEEMKAPDSTYITMLDVVPPTTATAEYGLRLKLAAIALLAGLVLGLSAAYGWTRLRSRRAAAASRTTRPSDETGPGDRPVHVVHEQRVSRSPSQRDAHHGSHGSAESPPAKSSSPAGAGSRAPARSAT